MEEGYCDADLMRIRALVLAQLGRPSEAARAIESAVARARERGAAGWERRAVRARERIESQEETRS